MKYTQSEHVNNIRLTQCSTSVPSQWDLNPLGGQNKTASHVLSLRPAQWEQGVGMKLLPLSEDMACNIKLHH